MGIIQSAVNQALGTVGTVAGIGRVAKTGEESLDLQKKAANEATAERNKKLENIKLIEDDLKKNERNLSIFSPDDWKYSAYLNDQLSKLYENMGDFNKAHQLMQSSIKSQNRALEMEENAMKKAQAKNNQDQWSKNFQKQFMEGVNTMKGVRSVTTFGADTGLPNVNMRTVYTPGREEVK